MLLRAPDAVRATIRGDDDFAGDVFPTVIARHGTMAEDHLALGRLRKGDEDELGGDAVLVGRAAEGAGARGDLCA